MSFCVGDLVCPDADSYRKAGWNPQGELRISFIKKGKRTGKLVIQAQDERGYKYTGFEDCFVKVAENKSK
ncbi:hypothetical protein [Acinetobacter haemolyticus]|uniref:hypothetical protein n=1 Tax=Acinetobacter haemolyticus TaxID=29430 RepID=UPI003EF461AE